MSTDSRQGEPISIPIVVCSFSGRTDFRLGSVNDIPNRCTKLVYGHYHLDTKEPISDADMSGIYTAQSSGLPVYVRVIFYSIPHWYEIMNEMNENGDVGSNYTHYIQTMIDSFIVPNNIDGIILDELGLFESADSKPADYAQQMNYFIATMKSSLKNGLTVGLVVGGHMNQFFTDPQLFDFNTAKAGVDMFIIDMGVTELLCDEITAENGRFPLTDGNMSLAVVTEAVLKSGMEKSKTWINYKVSASARLKSDNSTVDKTYKQYCAAHIGDPGQTGDPQGDVGSTVTADSSSKYLWCRETKQRCHDLAKTAKDSNNYRGIMISCLERDVFDFSCGNCTLSYPVTNAFLDGWEGHDAQGCPIIG